VDREEYWKLGEMEQGFNESAAGVRALASAWMLAALAAIGWLLDPSKAAAPWHVPVGVLATLVHRRTRPTFTSTLGWFRERPARPTPKFQRRRHSVRPAVCHGGSAVLAKS